MANPRDCEGNELPWSSQPCAPGPVNRPICYVVPPSTQVLPGFIELTIEADCTVSSSQILDQALAPVPGAVETGCPSPCSLCGGGGGGSDIEVQDEGVSQGVFGCIDFVGAGVTAVPGGCGVQVTIPGGLASCAGVLALFPVIGAALATDTFLVQRAGACAQVTIDCAFVQSLFPLAGATAPGDEFLVNRGGACVKVTVPAMATLCDQIDALDPIAPTGTMEIPIRSPGDGVCSVVTIQDVCDFCTPAFPLLAPDGACAAPSYSFTNNPDSGMFLEGAAVVIGWNDCDSTIEVGDIITLSALNGDEIEIGASVNITAAAGNVSIASALAAVSINAQSTATVNGGTSATLTSGLGGSVTTSGAVTITGAAPTGFGQNRVDVTTLDGGAPFGSGSIQIKSGNSTQFSGNVAIRSGDLIGGGLFGAAFIAGAASAGTPAVIGIAAGTSANIGDAGGSVTIQGGQNTGGGPGGVIVLQTGAVSTTRLQLDADGTWRVNGDAGVAGRFLQTQGPGAPPLWVDAAVTGFATPTVAADAAAATGGVATTAIRSDAKLQVSTAAPVSTGTANAAGAANTLARSDHVHRTLVAVQDGGVAVASRPTLNFIDGTNVTVSVVDNGGSDRLDITINASGGGGAFIQRFTFQADQLDSPVSADWAVNALAPAAAGTINSAIIQRRFDDTVEEGVGGMFTIPPGAVNVTFYFKSRAQTAPGGAAGVQPTLYHRSIPDNAAVGAWSAALNLTVIAIPTNTNWQYDSQTITLASLGWTAGTMRQFELTRRGTQVGDTLTGDWNLAELIVEFTT